jgi:PAS domain S-box-containing protein
LVPLRDNQGQISSLMGICRDITKLKQTEQSLLESEGRNRFFTETVPLTVWHTDTDGNVLDCNHHWCEYTGQTLEEAKGHGWCKALHPEDLPKVFEQVRDSQGYGEMYESEHRLRRASDGNYRWHLARGTPIKDNDGTVIGWIGCTIDIHDQKCAEAELKKVRAELEQRVEERTTELSAANFRLQREVKERRRAEEAWRQSHDELKTIYNEMIDGLLMVDVETKKLVWCNASMRIMLGYTEEELLSRSLEDIYPFDEVPNVLTRFRNLEENWQHMILGVPVLRKDGSVIYADINRNKITFNGRKCIAGSFRDITERQKAQEALRQSEERYRSVVEDQTEIICRFKADGTFIFVNDVFGRFFGKMSQELLGSKWYALASSEDLPAITGRLREISLQNPTAVVECRVCSGAGELRWMQIVARGIFDSQGRLAEIQSVGRDITERKQARQALEQERQSLWQMLQASDHERQIISYEIHDGLAQYLAAAGMQFQSYESLKSAFSEEADKAYKTAVELVRQAHFESRRLINEVRPPIIDEIGIETALSHLVYEQRRRGGMEIEFHSSVQFSRLQPILENALYRIVQEALTNACKHSKSKKVVVSMQQEEQDLRLAVQDWGVGFDPVSVEKGRFGLEGIRQRVRLLGGQLAIDSSPGSGTLVRVVLPIVELQNDGNVADE